MTRKILSIIVFLFFLLPSDAAGQTPRTKRALKKENAELRALVDSLLRELRRCQDEIQLRDSIADEMIDVYKENEDKSAAGLNPEDYSPEVTDSLLSIWYLHRQIQESPEGEGYNMDSLQLSSKVSDAVLKERLEKMNSFISLPYNETVRNYMILYAEKMPVKMGNILGLCQYYMPIFEDTFNRYGLPDELKYMAVIESALNPVAVSRAGAKGMWHFMLKTAKVYGLEINSFVDERLDPFKSADAAARYLEDSYKIFGDWNLAISSYNCGAGNVSKAIRRNGGRRDFWSVYDNLPRETRGYVPAFVGAMYAINYSKENGLTASDMQMPAQTDTFEIRRNLHFGQISELVGIPMQTLRNLNPQYIRDIIPGNSGTYILRIPFNYTNDFLAHEDSVYTYKDSLYLNPPTLASVRNTGSESGGRITYKVRSGDYLGRIAARYHVTVSQLKRWNHLKSNSIRVGQKLYIYRGGGPSESSSRRSVPTAPSGGEYETYTVQDGDTLYGIARKFPGISADDIMKANGIGARIHPGMKLRIPKK